MINSGRSYHIKDSFFTLVNDGNLMKNKEDGNYRPHFICFADPDTPGIFWAIPQSTRVAKFAAIRQDKLRKHGRCDTILLGNFGGKYNAFLIQNMFPVIDKYIDHEHTINGAPVTIHAGLLQEIIDSAKRVLNLHKRGYKFLFADVDAIYAAMKAELELSAAPAAMAPGAGASPSAAVPAPEGSVGTEGA